MAVRRLAYLRTLAAAVCFYLVYGEWFSYILLVAVLGLPILSLIVSLPGMITLRLRIDAPEFVMQGQEASAVITGTSKGAVPPFRGRLRLVSCQTGEKQSFRDMAEIPTEHCGGYRILPGRSRVMDYLGLFAFPARQEGSRKILVRPLPVPAPNVPEMEAALPRSWKPKPGGGYGENHELRPYRPGDRLNQVHWKLSAKTGSLTVRETMEPAQGLALVRLELTGTAEELDRKLGRLLWVGQELLARGAAFEIRALTAEGIQSFFVGQERELKKTVDTLLEAEQAPGGTLRELDSGAAPWLYDIGGEPDAQA